MKKITIEYCGMQGTGQTVKEAKQEAARKIETFLSVDHTPKVVSYGGRTAIAWMTPQGPVSGYIETDGRIRSTCHHETGVTMERVTDQLKMNLAMNAADVESDELPSVITNNPDAIHSYESWLGFQRAYRHATGTDTEKHAYACHNGEKFKPGAKQLS
jgi:hypothetical protein